MVVGVCGEAVLLSVDGRKCMEAGTLHNLLRHSPSNMLLPASPHLLNLIEPPKPALAVGDTSLLGRDYYSI